MRKRMSIGAGATVRARSGEGEKARKTSFKLQVPSIRSVLLLRSKEGR